MEKKEIIKNLKSLEVILNDYYVNYTKRIEKENEYLIFIYKIDLLYYGVIELIIKNNIIFSILKNNEIKIYIYFKQDNFKIL